MIPDHYTKIWLFHQKSIENWLFRVPGSLNSCWTFVHQKILGGIRILRRFPSLISKKNGAFKIQNWTLPKKQSQAPQFWRGHQVFKITSQTSPRSSRDLRWWWSLAWRWRYFWDGMRWMVDLLWKTPEMSNEKRAPGCLAYIGDEILPNI